MKFLIDHGLGNKDLFAIIDFQNNVISYIRATSAESALSCFAEYCVDFDVSEYVSYVARVEIDNPLF